MMSAAGNLQSRVLKSSWNDGLIDLFAGIGVLVIGVSWHFHFAALGGIAPALLVPLWQPLRRRLVEPRTGYMEFGEQTRLRLSRSLLTMLLLGVGTLGLGVATYFYAGGGVLTADVKLIAGLPAFLIGFAALVAGFSFGIPRFPLYALVLIGGGVITALLGLEPAPAMMAGGSAAALVGAVVLGRFLKDHPVVDEQAR